MSTGTLYIFCGKMASGKSTLARQIAEQSASTLISEDALLAALYPGEIHDVASYVHFSGKLKAAMQPVLMDLLLNGTSVVLDFPANTVKQRAWMNNLLKQTDAHHQLHYLNCSDDSCKARLKIRAQQEPERHATDTAEMFDAMTRYFEPPSDDEGFHIYQHQ